MSPAKSCAQQVLDLKIAARDRDKWNMCLEVGIHELKIG